MANPCCPHPVERHAYNGCANCGCGVRWIEHPDRDKDRTESAWEALYADRDRLRALALEACDLAISFDVHGSQPGERDRLVEIKRKVTRDR